MIVDESFYIMLTNKSISFEQLNPDVYRSVNYAGSRAKWLDGFM